MYIILFFLGDENRQTLLSLGSLEPLLKHIMSEDKIVRRNATMCLGTMVQNGMYMYNIYILYDYCYVCIIYRYSSPHSAGMDQLAYIGPGVI